MRLIASGRLLLGLVAFFGSVLVSSAEPILSTVASVYPGHFSGQPEMTDTDKTTAGAIGSDATFSTSSAGSSFSGSASAIASFGSLGAGVSTTIDNYPAQSFSAPCSHNPAITCSHDPVSGQAGFEDVLTILNGSGSGFLQLSFEIDGTSSLSHSEILTVPGAQGTFTVGPSSAGPFHLSIGFFSGPGTVATNGIEFTYGTPFPIAVRLAAFVAPFDLEIVGDTYDLVGEANFLNTAVLTDFRVFADPDLTQEVTGFRVLAESGTNYSATAVPEPATLLLLSAGGAVAFAKRRRRSRR